MRNLTAITFVTILLFSTNSYANDQTKRFFENYTQLMASFDHKVVNLYSDTTKIVVSLEFANGKKRSLEIDGEQWKQQLPNILDQAKSKQDTSRFSDISIVKVNDEFKVKANRYSIAQCFTDTGYYMLLAKKTDGSLEIIEEYVEAKPEAACQ